MKFKMKTFVAVFALAVFQLCISQSRDREDETRSSSRTPQITGSSVSVVMDGPVDPKEYIVGPGDIFTVGILSSVPLNFQVPVTPEGTVVIPTVSEVAVSGLSLEVVKKLVLVEIRKKYLSGSASFTLFQPRSFTVSIKGYVLNEQSIIVQATNRVDAAISIANDIQVYKSKNILSEQQISSSQIVQKIISSASTRSIKIVRKDGSTAVADIAKYMATGDATSNPLLRDGDVIIVPPNNIQKNFVGVYGAVIKNGEFEFVTGDSLTALIAIAGGLTNMADPGHVLITRSDASSSVTELNVDIDRIRAGEQPNIALQRGDRIIVPSRNTIDKGGVVVVEGEVVSPGSYAVIQDSTKLSEIISRAGGITNRAGLNAATIIREIDAGLDREVRYLQLRKGYTTNEDTIYFNNEMVFKNRYEIVSADFVALIGENNVSKDVRLRNGDRIIVPANTNAVYVFGEVKIPGFIQFVKEKGPDFYIAAAGGETEAAQSGDIKIIKAGTKQWLSPSETTIEEGDYVWIPKEPYRPFSYYMTIYSQFFGIIATVVSLVILVSQ
ncbi:MAG: SLBB domain-containing protein [Bacteroidota bacterium]